MNIVYVPQGSQEWLDLRAKHFTASEAPAMMGASKYKIRGQLLREKATGASEEVSPAKQAIYNKGHAAEAAARPLAEAIVNDDLLPITATLEVDGLPLLASFDGVTMDESVVWETKLLNDDLRQQVQAEELEPHYYWQLEQQLLIAGAEKALFTTSDGTPDGTFAMWYTSLPERRDALIAGWKQFADDLANYQHVESKPEPVGITPETLPALRIELTGMVTASNLAEFRETALAVIGAVNTDLQTDQDFANAEKAVKWCGDVEERLEGEKQRALSQTASIDELFRTMDEIKEYTRQTRLKLDKLVKARKDALRAEIVAGGRVAYAVHIAKLNERIGKPYMPTLAPDFAATIKGMRSFDSMRDAVNTALANAKIAANEQADRIELNLRTLREKADGYQALFHDTAQLVQKAPDDLAAVITARIAEHKEAEQKRLEAERERIAAEEREKLAQEQAALTAANSSAQQPNQCGNPTEATHAQPSAPVAPQAPVASNDGRIIKLGEINAALAPLSITAEGLATLGFHPVGTERAAKLYRASDFGLIAEAMIKHIGNAVAEHAGSMAA